MRAKFDRNRAFRLDLPPTAELPSSTPRGPSPDIREVAELLRGRSIVMIGGVCRPNNQAAIRRSLGLKELVWITTRPGESFHGFERAVARSDVALVLLAIRWSSHSYGEVQQYCSRYGKPLVRLPAGYNSSQIAAQIMNQCGERLRACVA